MVGMNGLKVIQSILLITFKGNHMAKYLFIVFAVVISMYSLGHMVYIDYKLYVKESECVAKHIALEVERKNIKTSKGTCYVKTN